MANGSLVPALSHGHAQAIAFRFAQSVQLGLYEALERAGEQTLANLVMSPLSPAINYWRPELGIARQRVKTENVLAGAVHWLCGVVNSQSTFELELPARSSVFLDGNVWSFPSGTKISVNGNEACFQADGESVSLFRTDLGWLNKGHREPDPLWQPGVYVAKIAGAGVAGSYPDPFDWSCGTADTGEPSIYVEALIRLLSGDSESAAWIRSVVCGVVLTNGDAEVASTDPGYPGLISLRRANTVAEAIDRIMDAASQQKLFQLAMAFALTDTGREEIHYLPSRRTYTTSRRLLTAAVQHVNAIHALMTLDREPGGAAHDLLWGRRLLLEAECWPALDASKSLTTQGADLWAEVKEHAAAVLSVANNQPSNHQIDVTESTTT